MLASLSNVTMVTYNKKTATGLVPIKQHTNSEQKADFLTVFANIARPTGFKVDRNGNAIIVA